ncbi:MAG TPA: sigma-70 family RNA polymerase sigma factor [Polyangiaceae bacterium]
MARTIIAGQSGYLSLIRRYPKISREREIELAVRWREHGDTVARDELVRSQLQNVAAIAHHYRRQSWATLDELIAEGNFGLLQAMTKFDPARGTRFVTYAVYWIRAYISQYLVRSQTMITTGVQSKMFSKIRRERRTLLMAAGEDESTDEKLARRLTISPERLRSLVERLELRDVSWETAEDAGLTEEFVALSPNPEDAALAGEDKRRISLAVANAMASLSARERYVVEQRHMAHCEDQLCLAEVGRHFCISRERARQIETAALRKLKAALESSTKRSGRVSHRSAA